MNAPSLQLVREIRDLGDELQQARINVLAGRPLDLRGVDVRLARICQSVERLPQSMRPAMLPLLEQVGRACDQLETLLRAAIRPVPVPQPEAP